MGSVQMTTPRKYLEFMEASTINVPVSEIRVGTIFLGNPKAPAGRHGYSAAMGEGIWVRTPHGVAGFNEGSGYDGQGSMHGWIVEGYMIIDADVLRVAVRLKRENASLRACVRELVAGIKL